MRAGIEKLTKRAWYAAGGFRNPALFRRATRSGAWQYFRDTTRADFAPAADGVEVQP